MSLRTAWIPSGAEKHEDTPERRVGTALFKRQTRCVGFRRGQLCRESGTEPLRRSPTRRDAPWSLAIQRIIHDLPTEVLPTAGAMLLRLTVFFVVRLVTAFSPESSEIDQLIAIVVEPEQISNRQNCL
jgi:hypothetical protein